MVTKPALCKLASSQTIKIINDACKCMMITWSKAEISKASSISAAGCSNRVAQKERTSQPELSSADARLTFSISCALTPGSKVKGLLDSQSCIVLVSLFHIPRASLHHKLAEVLAIVQYVPIDLSGHA